MTALHVIAAGFHSTIQDAGRTGYARSAVPPSGPADPFAFEAAQRLVGNDGSDAAIEIVGLPFHCVLDAPRVVAATGPGVRLRTRGTVRGWTSVFARAGEEIVVDGAARFAYLAVSGGIALAPVLGSRSTYVAAGIGPVPRALAPGDDLPIGPARVSAERAGVHAPPPERRSRIRATRGPHWDRIAGARSFFSSPYRVSDRSDRMGVRLAGPPIERSGAEILSIGVIAGAVQVPHGGDPIVLLADHQTTGGYPVVAAVIRADLGAVAQTLPGEELSFYEVREEDAVRALREERRLLDALA